MFVALLDLLLESDPVSGPAAEAHWNIAAEFLSDEAGLRGYKDWSDAWNALSMAPGS